MCDRQQTKGLAPLKKCPCLNLFVPTCAHQQSVMRKASLNTCRVFQMRASIGWLSDDNMPWRVPQVFTYRIESHRFFF